VPVATAAHDQMVAARKANISLLLLAGAGIAGLYSMTTNVIPFGKGFEMVALAKNLAFHGAYANPFPVLATGPTAANPPLYPFLLAVVFKVFRSEDLVVFVATLANILANALVALLLPRISVLFYRDMRPGVAAAVLWILASQLMPSWDVGFAVPTLIIFCLITAATIEKLRFQIYALVSGLLAAALFLFNPSTVLIFLPWIAFLAYRHRRAPKQTAAYCCLVFSVLIAAGLFWGFRNQQQLGKFVIRTNLGMTLYASDNDCARSSLLSSEENNCYQSHHPNTSVQEAQLLSTLGEIGYDRLRVNAAKAWIRTHPGPFLRLTVARVRDFWFPIPGEHPFKAGVIWLATLLSVPGLVIMSRKRLEMTALVLFVLSIYPLMYYIVVSDVRYRLPVLWLTLLLAGFFLVQLWDRHRQSSAK
jgi:hypothetical protein